MPKLNKLRKRAIISAGKYGFSEHAEDIAQEVLLHFIEGRGQSQTIDQAVVDCIRKRFGRPGHPGATAKYALATAESIETDDGQRDFAAPVRESEFTECERDLERAGRLFKGVDAMIFQMRFREEMLQDEIAKILGVTESRVCQRINRIQKELKVWVEYWSLRDRLERDEHFGLYQVDWIGF
jgi:RNA polymerase sigma factor (sigma-70 family)